MLEIKPATKNDYESVRNFYYNLTDAMQNAEFKPGWIKDVYPTREFLKHSIEKGELFIGFFGGKIAACMVINHEANDGYKQINWSIEASSNEFCVIHALGVAPDFFGRGFAKQMAAYAIEKARSEALKTVRLDVLGGNVPALRAYSSVGFQHVQTLKMFYEDTGLTEYEAFEYVL